MNDNKPTSDKLIISCLFDVLRYSNLDAIISHCDGYVHILCRTDTQYIYHTVLVKINDSSDVVIHCSCAELGRICLCDPDLVDRVVSMISNFIKTLRR